MSGHLERRARRAPERGSAFVSVLSVVLICIGLAAGVVMASVSRNRRVKTDVSRETAFQLAEAGLDYGLAVVRNADGEVPDVTTKTLAPGNGQQGTYTVTFKVWESTSEADDDDDTSPAAVSGTGGDDDDDDHHADGDDDGDDDHRGNCRRDDDDDDDDDHADGDDDDDGLMSGLALDGVHAYTMFGGRHGGDGDDDDDHADGDDDDDDHHADGHGDDDDDDNDHDGGDDDDDDDDDDIGIPTFDPPLGEDDIALGSPAAVIEITSIGEFNGERVALRMLARRSVSVPTLESALFIDSQTPLIDLDSEEIEISGYDHDLSGALDYSHSEHYAFGSLAPTVNVLAQIDPAYQGQITGRGGTPSLVQSDDMDIARMIADASRTATVSLSPGTHSSTRSIGVPTRAGAAVAYCAGDLLISGDMRGYGTLAVDGDLRISGDFKWVGLVIVSGRLEFADTENDKSIVGAAIVGDEVLFEASIAGTGDDDDDAGDDDDGDRRGRCCDRDDDDDDHGHADGDDDDDDHGHADGDDDDDDNDHADGDDDDDDDDDDGDDHHGDDDGDGLTSGLALDGVHAYAMRGGRGGRGGHGGDDDDDADDDDGDDDDGHHADGDDDGDDDDHHADGDDGDDDDHADDGDDDHRGGCHDDDGDDDDHDGDDSDDDDGDDDDGDATSEDVDVRISYSTEAIALAVQRLAFTRVISWEEIAVD